MSHKHPILIDIGHGLSLVLGMPTIASWKSADRPSQPQRGTFGFNTQTKNLEYWDGSAWLGASLSEA